MLLRFLSRRVERKSVPKRFRPRLEGLEAREVPAVCYWIGGFFADPTDATNPYNWEDQVAPTERDGVVFDGSMGDIDCYGLYVYQGEFESIRIINGYDGTVTLAPETYDPYVCPLNVDTLEITSGTLNPSANTFMDASVATMFTWTGGTLNNTTNLGIVSILAGATATISPPTTGSLLTGSTLSFEGDAATSTGSTGTFDPGTINFNNGADLIVEQYCVVQMKPTAIADIKMHGVDPNGGTKFEVKNGGFFTVTGENKFGQTLALADFTNIPIEVNGGKLTVQSGAKAVFGGRFGGGATESLLLTGNGFIYLENGSVLKAVNGGYLHDGVFKTKTNSAGGTVATFEGNMRIDGANAVVVIGDPEGIANREYGKLLVQGNVNFKDGQYSPVVNGSDATKADVWECTGTFEIDDTAHIEVFVDNEPPGGIPVGRTWTVIEAGVKVARINGGPTAGAGWDPWLSPDEKEMWVRKK